MAPKNLLWIWWIALLLLRRYCYSNKKLIRFFFPNPVFVLVLWDIGVYMNKLQILKKYVGFRRGPIRIVQSYPKFPHLPTWQVRIVEVLPNLPRKKLLCLWNEIIILFRISARRTFNPCMQPWLNTRLSYYSTSLPPVVPRRNIYLGRKPIQFM